MGKSIIYRPNVPIMDILKTKAPYSIKFGLTAIAFSMTLGLSMGVWMAKEKDKLVDKICTGYIVFINAVPAAVYLLFIQIYITSVLNLPMLFDKYRPITWILPAISMALSGIAGQALWMRRYMVDQLNQDYIRLARAKGMSESAIMIKHVMRNAFVPMAQYLPAHFAHHRGFHIY